jgi:hypothetical protein
MNDFFSRYSKCEYWSKKEAVALSLGIAPEILIDNKLFGLANRVDTKPKKNLEIIKQVNNETKPNFAEIFNTINKRSELISFRKDLQLNIHIVDNYKGNDTRILINSPEYYQYYDDFLIFYNLFFEEYNWRIKLLKEYIEKHFQKPVNANNLKLELRITPLEFIKWSKNKEIEIPKELEEMIRKYHSFEVKKDKEEYNTCNIELEQLKTKILSLEKELSVPNPKRAKSLYKAFIGLLSLHYTREKILQSFGENAGGVNPHSNVLITSSKIKSNLDLQGINLDDETIGDIIKKSISYLEEKSK